jgi:hypothetical protein
MEIVGTGAGFVISMDASQLERGYVPTDYFDGSYLNAGASWDDLPDDSRSLLYRDKLHRLNRLKVELPDVLPTNTAYRVTTGLTTKTVELSGFSS